MPEEVQNPDRAKRGPSVVLSLVLIVVILSGGVVIASWLIATRVKPPRTEVGELPPVVEVMALKRQDVTEQFVGYGSAGADRVARLAAEVPANVLERVGGIREGTAVDKGQPLIRLDDREYALTYDRSVALAAVQQASIDELEVERTKLGSLLQAAQSELHLADSERTRVTRLFEHAQAAKQEFDAARMAYQQALRVALGYEREIAKLDPRAAQLEASKRSYESAAELAKLDVERCMIKAPFAGSIDTLKVDEGDRVGVGTVLLTLVDRRHVQVPLQLPASSYDRIRVGASCTLQCESMSDNSWKGTIARVAPVVDAQTRTYAAYVTVDNTEQPRPLVPGTFVQATVFGRSHPDQLVVPRSAIRDGVVFVASDGKVHRRPVKTLLAVSDRAMVAGDLHEGDLLIMTHLDSMAEGILVRTTPAEPALAKSEAPADSIPRAENTEAAP